MSRAGRRSAAQTREHLLDVAAELFYWRGIHATGVDTVTAEAGVAPTTLYRMFGSKDGLVTAYVERAAQRYRERWGAAAEAGDDPAAAVLALFDELVEEVDPADCRGCLFLLAVAEIPDPAHPARIVAREVKEWLRAMFVDLATGLVADGSGDGAELGEELALLVEGVYGAVQIQRDREPALRARRMALRAIGSCRDEVVGHRS